MQIESDADPLLIGNRVHDGEAEGVLVWGCRAKGRLEGNELFCNRGPAVEVRDGGEPFLARNVIRDHGGTALHGSGAGVYLRDESSRAAVAADNVFARNSAGDVLQGPPAGPPPV